MKKGVRSIISILDLSKEEIEGLMDTADAIEKDPEAYSEICRHKQLATLFFEPSTRTYGRGTMEYDAQVDGVKVFSHLDGDLARLLRFREGLWTHSGKFEVVCFPQQAEFVRRVLGDRAEVREIPLEAVEKELLKGGDG